ncbi:MAG TPA: hypothetical protein DF296_13135 [Candidatus Margulisbacteria bacterium]|uniref:GIY-YIG domain-containing protein n=1 Tax=candidate division WWE3 bacterium GW2011_GWF2_42_42 TaxID=1619142 RepID=A0A0G1ADE3_UNCKA|nr:MAG: hypothetical protein UU99_C0009G0002 [Parcubacteria group bacterium GW2011_GWE2_42_14]KKS58954.1 MAG: hypothetical protein UV26_C0033G0002 [candidate division WWE3 bacterium GW2011_GWF2_42_42]HCT86128.1 hypothetical protein [Candidatus Margulisiibacteriota bacterium]
MKISGIYQIQSKIKPERIYIGSGVDIRRRWNDHKNKLRKNKHGNSKLQNHYNKYGESDLQFSVLLGCEKENLIVNEQFFFDTYPIYFNECLKANSPFGRRMSKESKEKISKANKGHRGIWGYKHTEEARLRIGKFQKGRIRTVIEMESLHKGINKGFKHSLETRRKMSEKGMGNRKAFGYRHTEEWKKEQSNRIKEFWKLRKSICQK